MDSQSTRSLRLLARTALPMLLLAMITPAVAMNRGPYSVEILVNGSSLQQLFARGDTFVEAREGQEYSIRLRNGTGRRVAVALSVDGLNSIDAKSTTAARASKWILGPYETITIDGWQTSSDTARRFFFTTEEKSYGAWLGKTSDLGVISAAFFREKRPRPPRRARPYAQRESHPAEKRRRLEQSSDAPSAAGRDDASRPAGESSADEFSENEGAALSDELAATGIGRELDHRVARVRFDSERRPVAVLDIRYEYRDALVTLGVLPSPAPCNDPLERRQRARGFLDTGFSPDPYRCR